jgi:hypothetical protein
MGGVTEVGDRAFLGCYVLSELEFDKMEIIRRFAFAGCKSLRTINMPSARSIGSCSFNYCEGLTHAVFGKNLGIIEDSAFNCCDSLRRITIPLKRSLIIEIRPMPVRTLTAHEDLGLIDSDALHAPLVGAFSQCGVLSGVDAVGGIHKTISSLHLESWKDTMNEEIDRINQILPDAQCGKEKTEAIKEWIESVMDRIEHYKVEHKVLVKEAMALLELALWKAKLLDEIDGNESARQEHRITSGASIVIKNVLPFLQVVDITT